MPLRGENVGTAYVRLLADGTDVPDGIRDALRDAEPAVDSAGEDHGKRYNKAFKKALVDDRGKNIKALSDNLAKGRGRMDGIAFTMGNSFVERFRESVRDSVQDLDVADTIIARLENDFKRTGDRNIFGKALANLPALQADAIRKLEDTERRYVRDREAAFKEHHRRVTDEQDAEFDHIQETANRAYTSLIAGITRYTKTARGGRAERKRLNDDLLVLLRNSKQGGEATHLHTRELIDFQRQLNSANPRIDRFTRLINTTADRSSRLFGRGSRNNFLNFFGSLGGNLIRLTSIIPRTLSGLATLGRNVGAAFETAGGGMKGVISGLGALATGMSGFAAAAAAGVIAVGALLAVLIPLSVILSTILAVVIALASSLTFALASGLAGIIGLLAPLAAGLGVAVAAFTALDDAQKEALKNDLSPLVKAFKSIGDVAAEGVFDNVREQARRLAPVITGLEPLVRRVSVAISDVGDAWIDMLRSEGFNRFRDEFSVALPGMVRTLGRIFGNVLGGVGGIFVAMIPNIQRFLGYLDRVTQNFSDWANSEEGQRQIVQFLDDAAESAGHVKDFLGEVLALVSTLFGFGRESGDDMFQSMADNAERLTNFLNENPEAVQEWFDDAKGTAEAFGDAVIEAGKLIAKLDSQEARDTLNAILRGVQLLTQALEIATGALDVLASRFKLLWGAFEIGIGVARRVVGAITGWWANMLSRARPYINAIPGLFGSAMRDAAARVGLWVARQVQHIQNFLSRARGIIQALPGVFAAAGNDAAARIAGAVNRMIGFIRGIPGRAGAAMAGLTAQLTAPFRAALEYISSIPGRIVGYFSGLAGRILSAIGTIDVGKNVKMPSISGLRSGARQLAESLQGNASGGIFEGQRGMGLIRRIGEAGAEALVPLNRDLSRVDPSVRWLSAIAQGKIQGMASGGVVGGGKTINAEGWTIVTGGEDPVTVAHEVVNQLVATGY